MFDTLLYAKRLKAVGVAEDVAEAHAEALGGVVREQLVTKDDLYQFEQHVNARFAEVENRFSQVDSRFTQMEYKLTIRLGALMVVGIGVIATLVKLL